MWAQGILRECAKSATADVALRADYRKLSREASSTAARATLWVFAVSLAAFSLLAILSIGSLFLPSVALALIACIFSLGRRQPALA